MSHQPDRILSKEKADQFKDVHPEFKTKPPGEFAAYVAAERAKWSKLIRDADIKLE